MLINLKFKTVLTSNKLRNFPRSFTAFPGNKWAVQPLRAKRDIRWEQERRCLIMTILNHRRCNPSTTSLMWFVVAYAVRVLLVSTLSAATCVTQKTRPLMQCSLAQGRASGHMIGCSFYLREKVCANITQHLIVAIWPCLATGQINRNSLHN